MTTASTRGETPRARRLSREDSARWYMSTPENPMVIGALLLFDERLPLEALEALARDKLVPHRRGNSSWRGSSGCQNALSHPRRRVRGTPERWPAQTGRPSTLAEAYRLQLDHARQAVPGNADPSRLDAEVAVRLRVVGHSPDVIVRAIREGAPAMRPDERRDWDAYTRRAADFAFSVPGSQLAAHLAPQRERLLKVEGHHHLEFDARPDESRRLGRSR
jgi:hypothetical protein